ncbi:uncharacterized protein [Solanum lycopersicum]|uniref:Mitochondrial import inner membrane translocase subunit Tim21 n=1 Tax=Solanum lycopersicum TaxID=4081 RepID=A0A3Q7G0M3_SOLLC|nr:uncharacterized protein LOC101260924 [Solanum lycopersicum]
MLGRRFISFLRRSPSASGKVVAEEGKAKTWGRRIVSGTLICLTGGVALSALDDLSIYHSCSSKALERASKNKPIIDAIGEPIVRGPWYNASLAVAHQRQSVSCTFPVSGPQGTGIFQLKAVRNGEDKWSSFLRASDWEILIMEALVHVPGNEEKQQTFRIKVSDYLPPPASNACTDCIPQESSGNVDKK